MKFSINVQMIAFSKLGFQNLYLSIKSKWISTTTANASSKLGQSWTADRR